MNLALLRTLKFLGSLFCILFFSGVFIYLQGVQYTLATLTNSWSNPFFNSSRIDPEQNCGAKPSCASGPIRVLTYNVLCRICTEAGSHPAYDTWYARLPHLREIVADYSPDIIGFQELGGDRDLAELNPDPALYEPQCYEFGPWDYSDAALFYRKDRFEAVASGQFWLNPKPDLPMGFAWEPLSLPRYVNWVHLRQKSNGFEFLYINTHFDNDGPNKEASATLVHDTFSPHAEKLPMILTGDFNTEYDTTRYHHLQFGLEGTEALFVNAADLAPKREEIPALPGATAAKPGTPIPDIAHIIDHIFLAGPWDKTVNRWVVDRRVYAPRNQAASDHPAVFAELEFLLRPPCNVSQAAPAGPALLPR
jgi:endonuclease/exonuclease/phosphatase family metal-dependent hydrolase